MEIWGFNPSIWSARDRFGARGISLAGGEGRDATGNEEGARDQEEEEFTVQSPAAGAKRAC
jgi:hypothetical protein